MLKLGNQSISAACLGGTKIKKAYLGETLVFAMSEPPVPTYTITASIDPAGSGTVSGAGTYQADETVTITATPGDGYQFTGWQENGAVVSEDKAYSFTVTGNRMLTAVFEEVKASRLPEGYTEVEYIYPADYRATLDTGINLNSNTVELTIQPLNIPSTASHTFYCLFEASHYSTYTKKYTYVHMLFRAASVASIKNYEGTAAQTMWTYDTKGVSSVTAVNGTMYNILYKPTSISSAETTYMLDVNGNSLTANGSSTYVAGPSATVVLGTGRYSDCPIIRYYSVKISTAEFVPCIDPSGIVGMYDLKNEKFRGPASASYKWLAGPAV